MRKLPRARSTSSTIRSPAATPSSPARHSPRRRRRRISANRYPSRAIRLRTPKRKNRSKSSSLDDRYSIGSDERYGEHRERGSRRGLANRGPGGGGVGGKPGPRAKSRIAHGGVSRGAILPVDVFPSLRSAQLYIQLLRIDRRGEINSASSGPSFPRRRSERDRPAK